MTEFEVDYLAVGSGESSGDAIALRFWDAAGQKVFVIDGGTQESGKALVEHIKNYYAATHVDAVISTHPDGDHASGLAVVLENIDVDCLLMHQPWNHADSIKHLFEDRKLTSLGLGRTIKKELRFVHDLKKIADRKGIPIFEPFAGGTGWNGSMHILGPSEDYYKTLLINFDCTPEPERPLLPLLSQQPVVRSELEWIPEDWSNSTLKDGTDRFSAENSSSAIILFTVGTNLILFTGDADEVALNLAADYAALRGFDLTRLYLLHVPHHGSKQNVGPTVLSRIKTQKAQISAGPAAPKHPSHAVINELIRQQASVYTTKGRGICHRSAGAPARAGWTAVTPEEFSHLVQK